jgi:hypothetical protein
MTIYVYSTLTNDQLYCQYAPKSSTHNNLSPHIEHQVFIAGQANITTKHFITPLGAVTEVSAEDLAVLRNNEVFQLHEKNGFITVSEKKEDADKVASGMTGRDESAPLTEEDIPDVKSGKVKVGGKK